MRDGYGNRILSIAERAEVELELSFAKRVRELLQDELKNPRFNEDEARVLQRGADWYAAHIAGLDDDIKYIEAMLENRVEPSPGHKIHVPEPLFLGDAWSRARRETGRKMEWEQPNDQS